MLITRYISALALALVVTFGLFYVMQYLITMHAERGATTSGGKVVDFVRLRRDADLQTRKRELPQKQKQPEPPPPPEMEMVAPSEATGGEMAIAAPSIGMEVSMAGGLNMGVAPSDTDIAPLVRVNPVYPVRATERGIEGYVIVEFTIAADGSVKDERVIEADPERIFDRAALRAVSKWKYKPKIEDGKAVERTGVKVKFPFELEK